MQDSTTAHTTSNSVNVLAGDFGEWVKSQGLWPACLPNLNPSDFHLYNTLKDKRMWIILIHYEDRKKIFGKKFLLFQDNYAMCLETFFQDVRSQKQNVSTSRLYFELWYVIM
jgi:hypothetical protein